MRYIKLDSDIKKPPYIFYGGRGNGRTFYQSMYDAREKILYAKFNDKYFNSDDYVWLIGEYENVPHNADTLFGVRIIFTYGTGIKLYKEIT